ncbi:MAG: tRNA (adenosine(37)-N6)-threonylcarbamoyltransferase complex dimerization subunit type 1 TsaB [Thiomicrospira sp.]|uniref:tRNA (adenosine(37)-N6)-threonylcarbamoyltransferase complex dimerization subunit type 1 TsaB n=1 Tax=Thiomicrospira sp. TaxID=935 RepID=UPI001A07ACA8|nr:tRNA (adenosine(37)-N6)-threonylcarbamoyltransferase complex dimerization subunit type 1 TsaB [Thiomicrospira sp.]MBE0493225.1 tRNA (adenosine(37)-N6)-threonylcarbamoyltransferase complex dimerization subunit type 1 TsaB [Thiomicrospira sp.]
MSIVLAVESATANCAASLIVNDKAYTCAEFAPQQHAQLILPMVDKVMQQAGIEPAQIEALVFGEGPGAFTGLRIAAGVVQGLALGWNKPVLAISSLKALAYQAYEATGKTTWWACLDARMGEIYVQSCEFDPQHAKMTAKPPKLVKPDDFKAFAAGLNGVGDIAETYPELVACFANWVKAVPQAEALARLALSEVGQSRYLADFIPQPVYLRPSVSS